MTKKFIKSVKTLDLPIEISTEILKYRSIKNFWENCGNISALMGAILCYVKHVRAAEHHLTKRVRVVVKSITLMVLRNLTAYIRAKKIDSETINRVIASCIAVTYTDLIPHKKIRMFLNDYDLCNYRRMEKMGAKSHEAIGICDRLIDHVVRVHDYTEKYSVSTEHRHFLLPLHDSFWWPQILSCYRAPCGRDLVELREHVRSAFNCGGTWKMMNDEFFPFFGEGGPVSVDRFKPDSIGVTI